MSQENLLNRFKEERIRSSLFDLDTNATIIANNYVFGETSKSITANILLGSVLLNSSGANLASSVLSVSLDSIQIQVISQIAVVATENNSIGNITASISGTVQDPPVIATLNYSFSPITINSSANILDFAILNYSMGQIQLSSVANSGITSSFSGSIGIGVVTTSTVNTLVNLSSSLGNVGISFVANNVVSSNTTSVIGNISISSTVFSNGGASFVNSIGTISVQSNSNVFVVSTSNNSIGNVGLQSSVSSEVVSGGVFELGITSEITAKMIVLSESNIPIEDIGSIFETSSLIFVNSTNQIGEIGIDAFLKTLQTIYANLEYSIPDFDLSVSANNIVGGTFESTFNIEFYSSGCIVEQRAGATWNLSIIERVISITQDEVILNIDAIPIVLDLNTNERIVELTEEQL